MSFQFLTQLLILGLLGSIQSGAIAIALQNKDVPPQSSSTTKHPQVWCAIDNLTDSGGLDLNPYVRKVALSVREKWIENLPPSLQSGERGKTIVEFRILTDGRVPEEFVKLTSSSDSKEYDRASLQGIHDAAPFNHLPENFSGPFLVVRATFYYNIPRT